MARKTGVGRTCRTLQIRQHQIKLHSELLVLELRSLLTGLPIVQYIVLLIGPYEASSCMTLSSPSPSRLALHDHSRVLDLAAGRLKVVHPPTAAFPSFQLVGHETWFVKIGR